MYFISMKVFLILKKVKVDSNYNDIEESEDKVSETSKGVVFKHSFLRK